MQICLNKLNTPPDPPNLPRAVLKNLLEFATKKSHFSFYCKCYDQINGAAMGSPLGQVLANIFTRNFEEKWVMTSKNRPSVWFRYVNDTFISPRLTKGNLRPNFYNLERVLKGSNENWNWTYFGVGKWDLSHWELEKNFKSGNETTTTSNHLFPG